jgi:PAS domain-containing protein
MTPPDAPDGSLQQPATATPAGNLVHDLSERLGFAPPGPLVEFLGECSDCAKLLCPEGRIRYVNGAVLEAVGAGDPAAIEGRYWWELWPEAERHALREAVATGAKGAQHRLSAHWLTARGEEEVDVLLRPIAPAEAGEVAALLVVLNARTANRDAQPERRRGILRFLG